MSDASKIEWTNSTWNPVRGCSLVSKGCTNCYAMKQAHRFSGPGKPYEGLTKMSAGGPVWTGQVRTVPDLLDQPLGWKKPRRIFVNSMSDMFHESVPDEFIADIFETMGAAPQHTFQILTKRPLRMLAVLNGTQTARLAHLANIELPLPNLWLGVSVEDQATADERIPLLLRTPAAVRWISAEPLLGPIDLTRINLPEDTGEEMGGWKPLGFDAVAQWENVLTGEGFTAQRTGEALEGAEKGWTEDAHIDWVVAGGESGPKARPSHPDWFRSLRDQCVTANVPFFFKQWGEWAPPIGEGDIPPGALEGRMYRVGKRTAGCLLDGRSHDEYPL